jgi:hypothetical protein
MSFLLEMCNTKNIGSLCVEFRLTFPYFSCTLPLFLGNSKHQRARLEKDYEEASTSQTMARAEPPPPPPQVEPNARGTRVLRGLTHEQLALVDVYKSENLIGGKYFDPSVLREFGFEDLVNRLLRQPQLSKVFEWRGPTYTPVTYEFLA